MYAHMLRLVRPWRLAMQSISLLKVQVQHPVPVLYEVTELHQYFRQSIIRPTHLFVQYQVSVREYARVEQPWTLLTEEPFIVVE